jgi:hypothetical protein
VDSVVVCESDGCDGSNPSTIAQIIKSSLCNKWDDSEVQTLDLGITQMPCASQLWHHDIVVITPHDILKIQSLLLVCQSNGFRIFLSPDVYDTHTCYSPIGPSPPNQPSQPTRLM